MDFLADADVFDGYLELVGDTDDHAALGSAVQLGDGQRVDLRGGGELFGLFEGVLARGAVEDEQYFVRALGHELADDVLDLHELVHEVDFVVETAGGVDDDDLAVVGDGRLDGVEGHGGGVGAHFLGHDRHVAAVAPLFELVDGGGAEGVGGAEGHRIAVLLELVGQFPDGGGLAHPFTPTTRMM